MAPQQHRPLVPLTPRTRSSPRALPGVALSETKESPPAWLPCWSGAPVGGPCCQVTPGFLGLPFNSTTAWEDPGIFQVTSKKMGGPPPPNQQVDRAGAAAPPPPLQLSLVFADLESAWNRFPGHISSFLQMVFFIFLSPWLLFCIRKNLKKMERI